MSIKKIVFIVAVATIPMVTIIGGLYFFGKIKQEHIIQEAIESIDNPYYQNLVLECGGKDESEKSCCIMSVYDMNEINAVVATDDICKDKFVNKLNCSGSHEWCVPIVNVTSPQ